MITAVAQTIGAFLAAVGGVAGVTALFKIGPERRKITADAFRAGVDSTDVLSKTAVSLLDPAMEQIKYLRAELLAAREEIVSLRTKLTTAENDIGALRHELKTLRAGLAT